MRNLLLEALQSSAPPSAVEWLKERIEEQGGKFQRNAFYFAFSGVSRHFPKHDLVSIDPEITSKLMAKMPGFSITGWDQFRLARTILLAALAEQDKETCLKTFAALLNTADVREQVALYSACPLIPYPEELIPTVVDGLRANIVDVFDAIALTNPFPATHFTEAAWNQMVLKSLFIRRPLYRIEGLDKRKNHVLSTAVSDLAHERWAAGRALSAEAWRNCVGFVDDAIITDLYHLCSTGDPLDRRAAALVVSQSPDSDQIQSLRSDLVAELAEITSGTLSWQSLGEAIAAPTMLNGSPASQPSQPS